MRKVRRVRLGIVIAWAIALAAGVAVPAAAQTAARFKMDLLGNRVPDVRAAAAIVFDPQTGEVLWGQNQHDQRSIASLTKLMTGLTFMAASPDLSEQVQVTSADVRRASVTYIQPGERISYDNLLHLTLIASDNGAARVLARTSEGGMSAFVSRMNDMAVYLGLTNTHYTDPSGLDADNVSTAYDISHLLAVVTQDPELSAILRTPRYEIQTNRRKFTIRSTNRLLDRQDVDVLAGKTGFIRRAGYCLATLLQVPQGSRVAVVVLGATNSAVRFAEARNLFNWVVDRTRGLLDSASVGLADLAP